MVLTQCYMTVRPSCKGLSWHVVIVDVVREAAAKIRVSLYTLAEIYLERALDHNRFLLAPYAYPILTCLHTALTLFYLATCRQNLSVRIVHLGYFDWSIGAPESKKI